METDTLWRSVELEIRQMLNTTLIDYVLSRYISHFKGQDRFDVVKMRERERGGYLGYVYGVNMK